MGERARATRPKTVALVLSGGVTRGAFEAGVLEALGQRNIDICRIVGTSSGALNGTVLAAGVRARRQREVTARISEVWRQQGGLGDVISPSLRAILGRRGFSDQEKLLALLRRHAPPSAAADPAPIELRIIVAAVDGIQSRTDGEPATSYMKVLTFADGDFDSPERIGHVHRAATASAAFPLLFAPVGLPGLGDCMDGGIVNNTPIINALDLDRPEDIDAVLVVAATPALVDAPRRPFRGFELFAHTVDMIFSEWLYRELRHTMRVNERIEALAKLQDLTPRQIEAVKAAIGWTGRRALTIASIRPVRPLPGTLFSGFTRQAIRRQYVEIGRARAEEVLDRLGWD